MNAELRYVRIRLSAVYYCPDDTVVNNNSRLGWTVSSVADCSADDK